MNLEEAKIKLQGLVEIGTNLYSDDVWREAVSTVLTALDERYNKGYQDERIIKIKDEYLKLLNDMLIDYDGWHTAESLKELIDETRDYIHKALKNDDKSVITVNSKKKFNILGEEVE